MTQITLNITNPVSAKAIRAIAKALDGVSIQRSKKETRKCGLDIALDDVKKGNVTHWESPQDLIDHINSL